MAIVVDNLEFGFQPNRRILNGITLDVRSGEVVAIVGPSGCGKSTLLRLIAGVLPRPHSENWAQGKVLLDGVHPAMGGVRPGIVSLMFQEPVLLPNRTVTENIALPLEMLGASRSILLGRVPHVVQEIGLADFTELRPSQLSVGMKTRVSLAMTIVTRPAFLLLDEPFASLDIGWRFSLYRTISDIQNTQHPTTILVTHDLHEAVLLAHRIVVIDSAGHKRDEFTVDLIKPRRFDAEELAAYNVSSTSLYSALERSVLEATSFVTSRSEGT